MNDEPAQSIVVDHSRGTFVNVFAPAFAFLGVPIAIHGPRVADVLAVDVFAHAAAFVRQIHLSRVTIVGLDPAIAGALVVSDQRHLLLTRVLQFGPGKLGLDDLHPHPRDLGGLTLEEFVRATTAASLDAGAGRVIEHAGARRQVEGHGLQFGLTKGRLGRLNRRRCVALTPFKPTEC